MPKSSQRVPPPCWTEEETRALIVAYRDRWFSANRGSLRSADWAAIASAVSSVVRLPSKTAVQCQHKVEKLRRRYREEKKKLLENPHRFSSTWELFSLLDSMEIGSFGPNSMSEVSSKQIAKNGRFANRSDEYEGIRSCGKIDSEPNGRNRSDDCYTSVKDGDLLKNDGDGVSSMEELARAIMMSAESFVKVEEMKMEVAAEMGRMRMEMELQRDKMMLDLQVMVVDSIANSLADFDNVERKPKLQRKRKRFTAAANNFNAAGGVRGVSNGSGGISNWGKR